MLRFILGLLLFVSLEASSTVDYNDFETNPFMSSDERETVRPYILPFDYPIREKLDLIFYRTRATKDINSLVEAGFQILKKKSRSFIIVASHPDVPGYIFKLHLDTELRKKHGKPGWWWFSQRVKGARALANEIERKQYKKLKAAKKWIYPLPVYPEAPSGQGYERKNVVLIAQFFELLDKKSNLEAWKTQITNKHLEQLYAVLKKCGGNSMRPDNIPFDKNGHICFIDTEYPKAHTNWNTIREYLSPKMQQVWDIIVR